MNEWVPKETGELIRILRDEAQKREQIGSTEKPVGIPTTANEVAWAEYAIALEDRVVSLAGDISKFQAAYVPIVAAYSRISKGPYRWCAIEDDENQNKYVLESIAKGKGRIHGLWLEGHQDTVVGDDPDRPDHAITLLWTGNGPCSEENAKALHEILTRLAEIAEPQPSPSAKS